MVFKVEITPVNQLIISYTLWVSNVEAYMVASTILLVAGASHW